MKFSIDINIFLCYINKALTFFFGKRKKLSKKEIIKNMIKIKYAGVDRLMSMNYAADSEKIQSHFDTHCIKRLNTQGYRSGHNEAVLKTVWPKATRVRIPPPAPIKIQYHFGTVFLFCHGGEDLSTSSKLCFE